MKFAENFFKFLQGSKKEAVPPVVESVNEAPKPESLKEVLGRAKQRMDNIKKLNNDLKHAGTPEKAAKTEGKITEAKQRFAVDFGVEYNPSFDVVKNALKSKDVAPVNADSNMVAPSIDNQAPVTPDANLNQSVSSQEPADPNQAPPVNPDQAQVDPASQEQEKPDMELHLNYREHLERIKIQEGKVEASGTRFVETNQIYLYEELKGLSGSLLSNELDKNLDSKLKDLAAKAGLPEDAIKEIYQNQAESLVAEAKAEINKEASRVKRIGLAVGKSAGYIGAGVLFATSTIPTFGLGAGFGIGAVAVARVFDRFLTDKILNKRLGEKTAEIKTKKTDDDKLIIQNRLAASISLKKQIEINKVNLNEKGERAALIDKYIEEQNSRGALDIPPDKLMDYKDKIIRTLEGLDDIDKMNAEKEAALNKTSKLDNFIKKTDKLVSGESTREKVVSAAVLSGLGLAAREIPGIRLALSAIAGYRLGGALVDHYVNKDNQKAEAFYAIDPNKEINNRSDYAVARRKLLDKDFQKNSPEEYLQLKKQIDAFEDRSLGSGYKKFSASALNKTLDNKIAKDKSYDSNDKLIKVIGRVGGTAVGLGVGGIVHELSRHFNHSNPGKIEAGDNIVDEKSNIDNNPVGADTTRTETIPVDTTAVDSSKGFSSSEGFNSDLENPSAGGSNQVPSPEEIPSAPKSSAFEDEITNENLKPGYTDSVWHSTNQIFKEHAAELGYDGDVNDAKALEAWSQIQTAKAINNSGELTDKVFEGNKIVLNHGENGDYRIEIEKGEGFDPGHLESSKTSLESGVEEGAVPDSDSLPEAPAGTRSTDYDELNKQFIEKSKADFRAQHEFLYHDKYGAKIDGVDVHSPLDSGSEALDQPASPAAASESVLFDRSQEHNPFEPVHSNHSASGTNNESAAVEEIKPEANKSAAEDPSAYKSGAEFKDLGLEESKKAFSSVDNLKGLPNGARVNLGELVMAKRDGVYHFETKEYEKFHLVFNKLSEVGQNDKFSIIRDGHVLDGKSLSEAIPLKQMLYDNLPDKRTSLAKELLKEIAKNKEQAEFLSEF